MALPLPAGLLRAAAGPLPHSALPAAQAALCARFEPGRLQCGPESDCIGFFIARMRLAHAE